MHPKLADSRPSRRRHPRRNRQNATRTTVPFPAPAAVNNDRSSTGTPQYVTISLPHAVASQHLYTIESPSSNLLLIQGSRGANSSMLQSTLVVSSSLLETIGCLKLHCNRSRTTCSTSTVGGKPQLSSNCPYA